MYIDQESRNPLMGAEMPRPLVALAAFGTFRELVQRSEPQLEEFEILVLLLHRRKEEPGIRWKLVSKRFDIASFPGPRR